MITRSTQSTTTLCARRVFHHHRRRRQRRSRMKSEVRVPGCVRSQIITEDQKRKTWRFPEGFGKEVNPLRRDLCS